MLHSSTTYGRNPNQGGFINPYAHVAQYGQFNQHGQFYTASNPDIRAGNTNVSADTLSQSLSGMSLRGVDCGASAKLNHAAMTNNIAGAGRMTGSQNNGSILYALPNGSFLYSNAHGGYGNYQYPASYSLNATQPSQIPQLQYSSVPVANLQTGPVTPRGQNWTTSQQLPPDLPELAAPRRSSVSSNEGESPQTPQFPAPGPGYHPSIYISNHSPTTWGPYTPSPQQLGLAGQQVAKNAQGEPIVVDFEAWTQAEPAIPDAIPAVYSPNSRGNLEQIMHNPNETTNVYVRGLHLDTTDAMLHAYGQRFGDVVSAKSIIDNATGLCKGFGFIRYHNYVDAENCIRGFYYRGYEAKWARVGHNERLKTLASPTNTNLYLSNLPKSMNEAELKAIFTSIHPEFTIVNHKVLKDENGVSRGVGFARFETPEICETVIREFQGVGIGEGKNMKLQIRYADTDEQKEFKAKTQKSRNFKSIEYNVGVALLNSPSSQAYRSPTTANFTSPLQNPLLGSNGVWMSPSPTSPMTPSWVPYEQTPTSRPNQSNYGLLGAWPYGNTIPTQPRSSTRVKIESPSVAASKKDSSGDATTMVNSSTESDEDEKHTVSKVDFATSGQLETSKSPSRPKL